MALADLIKKVGKKIYQASPINMYNKSVQATGKYLENRKMEDQWKGDYIKRTYPAGLSQSPMNHEKVNDAYKNRYKIKK